MYCHEMFKYLLFNLKINMGANPRITLLTLTALTEWFEVSGCQRRDRELKLGRMIEESERNRLVCVSCVSDQYSWRYGEKG